ncbi:MAG: hypothetical protein WC533_00020 [Candidatus Pacearchaeota archaeon]
METMRSLDIGAEINGGTIIKNDRGVVVSAKRLPSGGIMANAYIITEDETGRSSMLIWEQSYHRGRKNPWGLDETETFEKYNKLLVGLGK